MRNIVFVLLFVVPGVLFSQQQRLAKAKRIMGVEVYILSEPVRAYKIVDDKQHQRSFKMFQKDGVGKQTISSKLENIVEKAQKAKDKGELAFDAILYTEGKHAYPIVFTEDATDKNQGIGKVSLIDGVPVFIMCEPLTAYSIVSDKRKKRNFKSTMSFGWSQQTIREATTKWVKRFSSQKKKGKIDAVYYSYGKTANGIHFEVATM